MLKVKFEKIVPLVLKGVALAIGIAVIVLSSMNKIQLHSAVSMLGIGLACLAAAQFSRKEE